jgi:hypothetical protein
MSLIKKYLDWKDYTKVIDRLDICELEIMVKEENEARRKEIFRKMNFSG